MTTNGCCVTTETTELFATTIDAYGERNRPLGLEACERLLSLSFLPETMEAAVRRNQTWYVSPLAATGSEAFREPPYTTARNLPLPLVPRGWSRFNPSIAADPDGRLRLLVRSSNYTVDGEMRYAIHDADQVIRTRNYLVRTVDPESLAIGDWYPINDLEFIPENPPFPVSGYEDARLFWHDGWHFSATVRDRSERGICQMVMCDLDEMEVIDEQILSGRHQHEKNWMPVVGARWDPEFVSSCYPTTTVDLMVATRAGTWSASPFIARSFRGGSQLIPVSGSSFTGNQDRLALIHEAVDMPGNNPARVYLHRFVEFDQHLVLTRMSLPFCFHGRGLEFAAGMVRAGEDLIISYGTGDAHAWLLKIPLEHALSLLRDPLPEE